MGSNDGDEDWNKGSGASKKQEIFLGIPGHFPSVCPEDVSAW